MPPSRKTKAKKEDKNLARISPHLSSDGCPPGKIRNPDTKRCVNVNGKIAKSLIRPHSPKYGKGKTDAEQKAQEVDDAVRKLGLWKPMPKSLGTMSRPSLVKNYKKFRDTWERLAGHEYDMPDVLVFGLTDRQLRERLEDFHSDEYRELARRLVSNPRYDILKQALEIIPYCKSIEF